MTDPQGPDDDNARSAATSVDSKLLDILVCPLTKSNLRYDRTRQELISDEAGLAYPIRDGIPIMLVDEARTLGEDEAIPDQLKTGQDTGSNRSAGTDQSADTDQDDLP